MTLKYKSPLFYKRISRLQWKLWIKWFDGMISCDKLHNSLYLCHNIRSFIQSLVKIRLGETPFSSRSSVGMYVSSREKGTLLASHTTAVISWKYSPLVISSSTGDPCKVNVCQNGGTCVAATGNDSFICICSDGFTGETCDEAEPGNVFNNPILRITLTLDRQSGVLTLSPDVR